MSYWLFKLWTSSSVYITSPIQCSQSNQCTTLSTIRCIFSLQTFASPLKNFWLMFSVLENQTFLFGHAKKKIAYSSEFIRHTKKFRTANIYCRSCVFNLSLIQLWDLLVVEISSMYKATLIFCSQTSHWKTFCFYFVDGCIRKSYN